jgi:hypothetical protein
MCRWGEGEPTISYILATELSLGVYGPRIVLALYVWAFGLCGRHNMDTGDEIAQRANVASMVIIGSNMGERRNLKVSPLRSFLKRARVWQESTSARIAESGKSTTPYFFISPIEEAIWSSVISRFSSLIIALAMEFVAIEIVIPADRGGVDEALQIGILLDDVAASLDQGRMSRVAVVGKQENVRVCGPPGMIVTSSPYFS